MNDSPIGVFDSGIGGLTVAKAIKNLMPNEKIIYFGDTKHLPYGDKSPEPIIEYSLKITKFLVQKKCKTIVIACNSASASAFETIKKTLDKNLLILDVITPSIKQVINSNSKNIGIIATKTTVGLNIYVDKIKTLDKKINVSQLATPLLAPMIEEGFYNNHISKNIIENYLKNKKLQHIDTLILGCTHYPLIEKQIHQYYKNKVQLINSAETLAKELHRQLKYKNNSNTKIVNVKDEFFVSDYTTSFHKTAEIIFDKKIYLEKINF